MERWKEVPGYEGLYDVSDQGQVRSWKIGNGTIGKRKEPRLLKLAVGCRHGYQRVKPTKGGIVKTIKVAVLVLTAFHGPAKGMWALHRNGVRTDDRLENLYWGTPCQNQRDAFLHGTRPDLRGEHNSQSKLTNEQVLEIRRLHATGNHTQRVLSEQFGVTDSVINGIVNWRTWTHVGTQ